MFRVFDGFRVCACRVRNSHPKIYLSFLFHSILTIFWNFELLEFIRNKSSTYGIDLFLLKIVTIKIKTKQFSVSFLDEACRRKRLLLFFR
jgi:hypothetical protein